jgi:hypothetical protein
MISKTKRVHREGESLSYEAIVYMYVWTEKAEERARELGLEERKAGTEAYYGDKPVEFYGIKVKWVSRGYIEKV